MVDKNFVIIEYMKQCPHIENLYSMFSEAEDDTSLIEVESSEAYLSTYIDGRKKKRLEFLVSIFKSINDDTIDSDNENVRELDEMQKVIYWFNNQRKNLNYPDFGEYVEIDDMKCMQTQPLLVDIQDEDSLSLAHYVIQFQVEYIEDEDALLEEYENN